MTPDRKLAAAQRAVDDAVRELRRLEAHLRIRAARSPAHRSIHVARVAVEQARSIMDEDRAEIEEALTVPLREEVYA